MRVQWILGAGMAFTLLSIILLASYLSPAHSSHLYTTQPPAGAMETTIAAEQTWIARFTQEPTYSASLTPYYVEVIAREIGRQNMTSTAHAALVTPTPTRTGTPPTLVATATCAPTIEVRGLEAMSRRLDLKMSNAGLDTFTEIRVGYVDHIDGTCRATPRPFTTTLEINVNVDDSLTQVTQDQLGNLLAPVLGVLADFPLPDDLAIRPIGLRVVMVGEAQNIFLTLDYYLASRAVAQGLTGAELMAYLRRPF